jgi:hypothetical protein
MSGLGFLLIVALYVAAAVFVVKRIPMRWGKALAVVVFLLIPTADALWGRYVTLPELCKDAGLTVVKKASKQDGMMVDGNLSATYKWIGQSRVLGYFGEEWITQYGLSFVEGRDLNESISRLSSVDGKVIHEDKVAPKSKYILTGEKAVPTKFGPNFRGGEIRIDDRTSGEVISRYRGYGYNGGWAERFLGNFADSGPQGGASCPPTVDRLDVLIRNTFN